jgi:hypothetical protein
MGAQGKGTRDTIRLGFLFGITPANDRTGWVIATFPCNLAEFKTEQVT